MPRTKKRSLIIFTTLPKVGGHTTITLGLARLLSSSFDRITVIAKELPGHGVSNDAVEAIRACGGFVHCVGSGLWGNLKMFPVVMLAMLRSGMASWFLTIDMGRMSPKLARLFHRDRTIYYHIKHELTPTTLNLLAQVETAFKTICFISAATAKEYATGRSIDRKFPVLIQPSEMQNVRPSSQRVAGPVRLGFLGRLSEAKGSKVLLDFFKDCTSSCELVVAGLGDHQNAFLNASKETKDSFSKIRYLGAFDVDERDSFLSKYFASIDYLLVPTQDEWEGTPTVILEALQFGVPTIATACGGTVGLAMDPFNEGRSDVVMLYERNKYFSELERIICTGPPSHETAKRAVDYFHRYFSNSVLKTQWLSLLSATPLSDPSKGFPH